MPNKAKLVNLIINPAAVIKRNAKGQFLTQPPPSVRDPEGDAHRPTDYGDEMQAIADKWLADKIALKQIAWLEELCILLDINEATMWRWSTESSDTGLLSKPKFCKTIEKAMAWQKMILKNNGISGKFNSRMSMFLLSANHETVEKKEVANKFPDGGMPIDLTNAPKALDPKEFDDWLAQRLKQGYVAPDR
jgi:hypothetical protein